MKPPLSRFSNRFRWSLEENDLSRALSRTKAAGSTIFDLTESNPTKACLVYPAAEILRSFDDEALLRYSPEPRGARPARDAVSRYYAERGAELLPDSIFLTASTSEAYGFLFKLLCDPGSEILVPRPSYPLFEFLASLEGVVPVSYPLRFDGTWHIDFGALQAAVSPRTRAVVVVHPNNPTGSYVAPDDRERLLALGLPVIVDEVFLDFPLTRRAAPSFAGSSQSLVFVLSGLSKLAGLPQMKLGWIGIAGDSKSRDEAALRLEHIADAYLSVGAPVQLATPSLFELGARTRRSISERTLRNLGSLRTAVGSAPAVTLPAPEGGWYAPLRLPGVRSSEEWALSLLEDESVFVHPGSFFGFYTEAHLVLSLLTPETVFDEGVRRILSKTRA